MSDDTARSFDDAPSDDTAGHVLHGEAAENPATGGGRGPSLGLTGEPADDTEGHRRMAMATGEPEDDTEGHRRAAMATGEPEDDTEGHRRLM